MTKCYRWSCLSDWVKIPHWWFLSCPLSLLLQHLVGCILGLKGTWAAQSGQINTNSAILLGKYPNIDNECKESRWHLALKECLNASKVFCCVWMTVHLQKNKNKKICFWVTLLLRMFVNIGVGNLSLGLSSKVLSISEAVCSSIASTSQVNIRMERDWGGWVKMKKSHLFT